MLDSAKNLRVARTLQHLKLSPLTIEVLATKQSIHSTG